MDNKDRRTHLVFVYGSLLSGLYNHRLLSVPGATLVARDVRTRPIYDMVDRGPFPSIRHDGTTSILGEVYRVTPEVRTRLDFLEGHPRFYERSYIHLVGEPFRRWHVEAYFLDEIQTYLNKVPSGDWRAHLAQKRRNDP